MKHDKLKTMFRILFTDLTRASNEDLIETYHRRVDILRNYALCTPNCPEYSELGEVYMKLINNRFAPDSIYYYRLYPQDVFFDLHPLTTSEQNELLHSCTFSNPECGMITCVKENAKVFGTPDIRIDEISIQSMSELMTVLIGIGVFRYMTPDYINANAIVDCVKDYTTSIVRESAIPSDTINEDHILNAAIWIIGYDHVEKYYVWDVYAIDNSDRMQVLLDTYGVSLRLVFHDGYKPTFVSAPKAEYTLYYATDPRKIKTEVMFVAIVHYDDPVTPKELSLYRG